MPGLISLDDLLLGRGGSRIGTPELELPTQVIKQTPLDRLEFNDFVRSSPRFREVCVEDAPKIPAGVREPDPIDLRSATGEELHAYQEASRAAREAIEQAPRYTHWDKLTEDMFASYHTRDIPQVLDVVDPAVDLHRRILPQAISTEDHARSRFSTRGDAPLAAIATMAFTRELRKLLGDKLFEQAQEAQAYTDKVREVEDIVADLQVARDEARLCDEAGEPINADLRDLIKQLVHDKRAAQGEALALAQTQTPISRAAATAIQQATKVAAEAAEKASGLPSFGSGFGAGEPVYESPEQALTIAQMWSDNEKLRQMAALFGRVDPEVLFLRSKRVEGGNDEIVDVRFGDNLPRILPGELALLGSKHRLLRLDFLVRYADQELLEFSTVGEEHAGRGPVICIIDGSGSMQGDRTIWARAIAMTLLHICRLEKRDFAAIEFANMDRCETWEFPAKEKLDPQRIVNMAAHFFGGGTHPLEAVREAARIMEEAPPFRKADIVMIGDGEAQFESEDRRLRDKLAGMGVRIFGVAIGGQSYQYLTEYCQQGVVSVNDFDLQDPSEATAALAVQIS